ncbi:MAG: C40 family peptidase [Cellulomonadaceae bacterium]|jgi:cell wall-associated NlpC family hydrolase|nr:C40 family peptidase [Cellulomonadaceae bacterium]
MNRITTALHRGLIAAVAAACVGAAGLAAAPSASAQTVDSSVTAPVVTTQAVPAQALAAKVAAKAKKAKKHTFKVGQVYLTLKSHTLTANVVKVSPKPSKITYQWYRNGKKISGAKHSTYTLRSADSGKVVSVVASVSRSGYVTKKLNSHTTANWKKRDVKGLSAAKKRAEVVEVARGLTGVPYVRGGSSPRGLDCSGLTQMALSAVGKNVSTTSSGQRHNGHVVSRAKAQAGDIVWTPGHVAIYAGHNTIIEASQSAHRVVEQKMWQRNPVFIRVIG